MKTKTRFKIWIGRLLSKKGTVSVVVAENEDSREYHRILNAFSGSYVLGTERIHVPPLKEPLKFFDVAKEDKCLVPVASVDDQFNSLLLADLDGKIYMRFTDDERETLELYADSFEAAMEKMDL